MRYTYIERQTYRNTYVNRWTYTFIACTELDWSRWTNGRIVSWMHVLVLTTLERKDWSIIQVNTWMYMCVWYNCQSVLSSVSHTIAILYTKQIYTTRRLNTVHSHRQCLLVRLFLSSYIPIHIYMVGWLICLPFIYHTYISICAFTYVYMHEYICAPFVC